MVIVLMVTIIMIVGMVIILMMMIMIIIRMVISLMVMIMLIMAMVIILMIMVDDSSNGDYIHCNDYGELFYKSGGDVIKMLI